MQFVALLRGINVGGNNPLPMANLRAMFEDARCEHVRSYIQSGNIVFEATEATATSVPKKVQSAIAKEFGFDVPVIVRSDSEWRAIMQQNPFLRAPHIDPRTLHVAILSRAPVEGFVLDRDRCPPDKIEIAAREAYLHLPNGVARTKFTNAYLDRAFGVVSTVRNWRTVSELAKMMSE